MFEYSFQRLKTTHSTTIVLYFAFSDWSLSFSFFCSCRSILGAAAEEEAAPGDDLAARLAALRS